MKFTTVFGSLLCAATALAGNSPGKRNVYDKVKAVMEKRVANEPFKNPEIQKRAVSYSFATNKTERQYTCCSLGAS